MATTARTIIVGGGIVGVSILYHLAKAGEKDALLLERRNLSSGATWHSAGNVHTQSAHANLSLLQAYSLRLYGGLEQEVGQRVDAHVVGGFFLAQTRERMEEFKHLAGRFRSLGIDYELVTAAEIESRHPLLSVSDLAGGAWDPGEGHVDPHSVTMGLAAGARKFGGRIIQDTQVDAIRRLPSGNWCLTAAEQDFKCEVIVNCAGFWAREVAEMVGATVPVTNMEHQYLVTTALPAIAGLDHELPVVRDTDSNFYMRQEGNGLLLGPWEQDCRLAWDGNPAPWSFGQELFNDDLDRLQDSLEAIYRRVPALETAGVRRVVNGAISFSPDGRPIVGPMPGVPGFFVACGFLGGIAQAGGIGLALSQWILDGQPELDLHFVDVARFGDWTSREFARERTYEILPIRYELAYPGIERSSGRPIKVAPIYSDLLARGAVMGQAHGWEVPLWFAPEGVEPGDLPSFQRPNWWEHVGNEARKMAGGCGVSEMSSYGKLRISGPDAHAFLDHAGSAAAPERKGKVVLSLLLNQRGRIVANVTIDSLGDNVFQLVGATRGIAICQRWLERLSHGFDVRIRNITEQVAVLGVAGPFGRKILNSLSGNAFDDFPFMSSRKVEVGRTACRALRVSYSGELGWELQCPVANQKALFDSLMSCRTSNGTVLVGSRAMGMMRLEKGYRSWGADITSEVTPHAAGLQRFCSTRKDYVGRAAVDSERVLPPRRRLVTLEMDPAVPPCWGTEPILKDGNVIGRVTSGGMGWRTGRMLAVGWIDAAALETGCTLQVQILLQQHDALVVPDPVYDPDNHLLSA